jgi:predicted outer membrane repeat protein
VRSGEVSYNTASLRGGGIGSLGNVTVLSGEISNNSVSGDGYGGGIYIGGTLTASGGEIFNNSASNSGGGICSVTSAGTITIDGSYIHNNSATSYGGGIYSAGEINLNNGMIGGNSPSQANSSNYGGGIYAAGVLNMTNGKVAYNTAERGGGIYVNNDDTVNISGGEVSNNAANGLGGGILGGTGSTTNLTGGVVSNNTAASRGGGIYIFGALNMSGGILSGNNATGGAGVYFSTSSAINLSGSPQIGVSQSDNGIAFVAGKVLKVIGDLGSSSRINIETIPSAAAGVVVANKVDSSSTAVNAIDSDAAKFYYAPGVALDPVIKVMPSGTNYVLNTLYLNINLSSNIVQIAGSSGLSPTAAGVFVSGSNILTTNTNNPAGYSVSISTNLPSSDPHASDMSHQSIADTYLPVSANVCSWDDTAKTLINTNNTLSANTYGFTIDSISLSSQKLCRIPDQNSPLTIKSTTTSSLTGDTTTFYYGTKIDLGQVAGEYRASIVYTVVPNP